jgi:DNA repair exonuclease SbcCD ATPase subunit
MQCWTDGWNDCENSEHMSKKGYQNGYKKGKNKVIGLVKNLESEMEELRENFKLNVLKLAEKESENASLRRELDDANDVIAKTDKENADLKASYAELESQCKINDKIYQELIIKIKKHEARWSNLKDEIERRRKEAFAKELHFLGFGWDSILKKMQELESVKDGNGGEVPIASLNGSGEKASVAPNVPPSARLGTPKPDSPNKVMERHKEKQEDDEDG